MKKITLSIALLSAMTGAQAYQNEIQGVVGYYDAELNDGNYNAGVQGTHYFKQLDTSKGPLAEAAFMNQASNISVGYSFGQLTGDIDVAQQLGLSQADLNSLTSAQRTTIAETLGTDLNLQAEADTQQHTFGIKGETYIPTNIVPVYASASYSHSFTDAKNDFSAKSGLGDDSGDRFALELGAVVAPNFLVAVGYTSVAATQSLDTFNLLNNGLMLSAMEARTISEDQDAITARTKYVGAIDGTDMSVGFEAGITYGEESLYQFKTDLYVTPKLGFGVSYTEGSYESASVPTSALGLNTSYFVTPAISLGANYVYANGEYGAKDAQLGSLNAKFRF